MTRVNLASRRFHARAHLLGIATAHLTGERGAGRDAASRRHGRRVDQCLETRKRVGPVQFLRAVLLGLDDDDAFLRDALIESGKQT